MLQRTACLVVSVFLLAACATTEQRFEAGTPCEAATFAVVDDFVGSRRGACTILSDNHVLLSILPEDNKVTNPSAWYAFKIIPNTATTATTATTAIISLQYADGYHRYVPKTSSDGKQWSAVNEESVSKSTDGMSATLTAALNGEPLWVSAQELITPAIYGHWTQAISDETDARLGVLGRSKMDQVIEILTVNDDARDVLLLTGRQHPPEVSGAVAFFAFFEALLTNDDLAKRFRDRFQIIAVPLLNPDGVSSGNWRHNLGMTDLNRDWGPFKQPETRLISDLLDRLDAEGKRIRVFLDFHSTADNVFYIQDEDNVTDPPGFFDTWLENARPDIPDSYPFAGLPKPTDAIGIGKNYMYQRYGIPASTYEVGDETDRKAARQAAVVFAEELMRLMLEQEFE